MILGEVRRRRGGLSGRTGADPEPAGSGSGDDRPQRTDDLMI